MNKILTVNMIILIIILVGALIFDMGLELGGLHGVVFTLYTVILSSAALAINIILAIIFLLMKNKKASSFALSSLVYLIGIGITYIPKWVIN
jgi:hypothetical protein